MASAKSRLAWSWSTWKQGPWKSSWLPSLCPGSCASESSTRRPWAWTSCTACPLRCSIWTSSLPTSCLMPTTMSRYALGALSPNPALGYSCCAELRGQREAQKHSFWIRKMPANPTTPILKLVYLIYAPFWYINRGEVSGPVRRC